MATQSRAKTRNVTGRRPFRIAAVQLKYVPNHRPSGPGLHLLAQEPLIGLGQTGAKGSVSDLLADTTYDQLRRSLRASARDLLDNHEKLRISNYDKKIRRILKYCHEESVDIVIFPECSIPPSLVSTLLGFHMATFAGLGLIRQTDFDFLQSHGFPVSDQIIGCNAAVFISGKEKRLITKKYAAEGEEIEQGTGVQVARVAAPARGRTVGLAICKDYLREEEEFRGRDRRVDVLLTTALTNVTHDFTALPPRDFIRVFSNWAFSGSTAVMAPNLQGLFVRQSQTEPIPVGEEAVVIVDWDFFQARLTPLDLPTNRLVRYAAIVDLDGSTQANNALIDAIREMPSWTLTSYRAGGYAQSLRIMREFADQNNSGIIGRAIASLSESTEDGIDLTNDDFECLTSHIILEDVLREEEVRYRLLEELIERWHQDRRTFPHPDSGRFIAAAEGQRRQLEAKIRLQYRSRQISPVAAGRREPSTEPTVIGHSRNETFYAARLGSYTEKAVTTLPRQLDLLNTVAESNVSSLRLAYRISTYGRGPDDLVPVFDVIAAADPQTAEMAALVSGIGEQIGTVFSAGWNLDSTDANFHPDMAWVAQLRFDEGYVPAIGEDWAPLVDYLRTLETPVQVQLVLSPEPNPAQGSNPESLDEPIGFLSPTEQSAAAYLTRAGRVEQARLGTLRLRVDIGAYESVAKPVLQTIARWLLRSSTYELDTSEAAKQAFNDDNMDGAAILSPAQALRIFHPPYGPMESRGLANYQDTNISLPSGLLMKEGIELGKARVIYGSYDRKTPVRLSPESRRHHVYILGRSGSGKTNLLKNMARQDIESGHGLAVIDPHGDLVDYLIGQVGQREAEVALLDFGDHDYLPILNPLDLDVQDNLDRNLAVEEFIDLVERQSFHQFYGPRFRDLVRLAIDSVLDPGYPLEDHSLVDFPPILRSDERRAWLRNILRSRALWDRWAQFEQQSPTDRAEVLHWALAKFTELTEDNILGQVLGGGSSTISIRSAVEHNGILLVKIPEWEMSRSAADFLGAFVQERVRRAIYGLWRQSHELEEVRSFNLYVDEFQAFATTRFEEMLAEARKFGLCLTLANQNVRQLQKFSHHTGAASSSLLEAVFGNVSTMVYFGGSSTDDEIMASELNVSRSQLSRLPRYSAAAKVMLDERNVTCTLEFPLATAIAGLPKPAESVRERMIDSGTWVKRDALRERLVERLQTIAQLTHVDEELPSPTGDEDAPSTDTEFPESEEDQTDGEDVQDEADEEDDGDGEENDRDSVPQSTLTLSWPWNPDQDDVGNTSYLIRDNRLHIVFNGGPNGLGFNRRLVRFGIGSEYRSLDASSWTTSSLPKRRDRRPLIISFPYVEGCISKVSYTVNHGVFTLMVRPMGNDLKIRRSDVKYSRGVLVGKDNEVVESES